MLWEINMDLKEQAAMLDLVVRVFCLEKFLIEKEIISKEDYLAEVNAISEKLIKQILDSVNLDSSKVQEILKTVSKNQN